MNYINLTLMNKESNHVLHVKGKSGTFKCDTLLIHL